MIKMIESVQELPITLTNNSAAITFSVDDVRTRSAKCCNGWLSHRQGSPLYQLLQGGYYKVKFKTLASSTTPGVVALGLYQDGILVPGTTTASTITAAGDVETLTFSKVIPVCGKAGATLTIASVPSVPNFTDLTGPGVDTQTPIIASANVIIDKEP
jgi:hypothetical protein